MQILSRKHPSTIVLFLFSAMLMGAGGDCANEQQQHNRGDIGLNETAIEELLAVGVGKYLGDFTPVSSEDVGDGWTKHTFDRPLVDSCIIIQVVFAVAGQAWTIIYQPVDLAAC